MCLYEPRNCAALRLRIYKSIYVVVKFNKLFKVLLKADCFSYEYRNGISKVQKTGNVG
jgi:hypothetical protein